MIYANHRNTQISENQQKAFTSDFTSINQISDFLNNIKQENINRTISLGIVSPESKNCYIDNVVSDLKERKKNGEITTIFLPSNYTQQDVENFKKNLNIDFQVKTMNEEVSKSWLEVFDKKNIGGIEVLMKNDEIRIK